MKRVTAIQVALIALPVGAVCLASDARANTSVRVHGGACFATAGSGTVVNQWGISNQNGAQTAVTVFCPFQSATPSGILTGSIMGVYVTFWQESVASGQPNFSCTVNMTNQGGYIMESFTKSSSTTSSTWQTFSFDDISSPQGPYPWGFMTCTLPGYGTAGYYNYLSSYAVDGT
jgi:hypothetical protein